MSKQDQVANAVAKMAPRASASSSTAFASILLYVLSHLLTVEANDQRALSSNVKITFDLSKGHAMPKKLWSVFFEEIQHAGDGGLYAELISDRSFGGLAYSLGLPHSEASTRIVPATYLESQYLTFSPTAELSTSDLNLTGIRRWRAAAAPEYSLKGQPRSWLPVGKTALTLVKEQPITLDSEVSPPYIKISTGKAGGGLTNTGYWGIPVEKDHAYQLAVILQAEFADDDISHEEHVHLRSDQLQDSNYAMTQLLLLPHLFCSDIVQNVEQSLQAPHVTAKLESKDGTEVYASAHIDGISSSWSRLKFMLSSNATADAAQLTLYIEGEANLAVRLVSLFPAENVKGEMLQPFRADILQYLKDLHPRYIRMPGGCYVEGVKLATAAWWKPSVGPFWERPGHFNSPWHYWSTDGLGVFEYFQLAEALEAEPVWVINNGIAHEDMVPAAHIWPLVQDALDLIEFVSGPADSEWGSMRNKMGRSKPWDLNYFAIGNEDCGKPWYVENYIAFFTAIRAKYPHMQLISNCDMGDHAPTEIFDWHKYTDSQNMFDRRHDFDNMPNIQDKQIFASEYAVFDDPAGHPIPFPGNARASIAEAAFMTGIERNSEHVTMAAFAPLLSRWEDSVCPHSLIIFNSHQVFGVVSYYVQKLFSEYQGVRYIETAVSSSDGDGRDHGIAASASCQNDACTKVAFKMVNFHEAAQRVDVEVLHLPGSPDSMTVTTLNSTNGAAENSFAEPFLVIPKQHEVQINGPIRNVTLPAYSLTVVSIDTSVPAVTLA